ncbi:type II toxin-antitoxin system mRNA interferase toxin, RelE/StbE family [Fructobacillus fructosus]|nr:type II toxin-antitoxin system mRNA interferase toxin, RelE/StbE family [Fructobacillus fructosus]MCK8638700.1 type II toxin-antitoxin system YafQ family toxin [Fructobacillus fructosus]
MTNNPECHELHIKPDWLLVYRYDGNFIKLIETGSHTNLF